MSLKKSLYILLVMVVAGVSALTGALAGGAVVYRAVQQQSATCQRQFRKFSRQITQIPTKP